MESNKIIPKGILFPFILLTTLFFAWAVPNNLTDTMLAAFKRIMSMSDSKTAWIQVVCYLLGYGCCAVPGALFIKKYTYKSGVMLGLGLYAFGALLFYPAMLSSGVNVDFSFFMYLLAIFVLFAGLSVLETSTNSYVLAIGPESTATRRLNLSQAFNPFGAITGVVISQIFILSQLNGMTATERAQLPAEELAAIQGQELNAVTTAYVVLGLVMLVLLLAIRLTKMPNLSEKGEKIDKLLKDGYSTLSLGYIGVYETTMLVKGVSHTTEEGEKFAVKLMKYLRKACDTWKKETHLGFALYGTPAESLCYRFARIDKERFGSIKDVTDKGFYTNSYHVHVTEEIDAFSKLQFESQFHDISLGGCISYVEVPDMSKNLPAVEQIINYIYHNIQYAEINTKPDVCFKCGFNGEMQLDKESLTWHCPSCGNDDESELQVMRRTCGYIGSNFWNKGRTQEIKERVLHIDNKDYVEEDECKCGCEKHEHSEEKETVTSK